LRIPHVEKGIQMTSHVDVPSPSAVETVDHEPDKLGSRKEIRKVSIPGDIIESDKVTRSVLVIAPFGGNDREKERRAILDVMRIKYLIERKVQVKKRRPTECLVDYKVDKHRNGAGLISPEGIRKIASADVLVALMTEINVNVAFELAVRNMLRPEVILIVRDPAAVPVYAHDLARIGYDHADNKRIHSVIDNIAEDHGQSLDWDDLEPPEELRRALDSIDGHMTRELRGALTLLEESPSRSIFEQELTQDLDPGRVLGSWNTYVPYAVFRINWQRKASPQGYNDKDREGEPMVVSGNEKLRQFIDWEERTLAPPGQPGALSLPEMIVRIGSFMSEDVRKKFLEDQDRLYNKVILGGGFGSAKEPIVFTEDHPRFGGKRYLPTLVALRRVGNVALPHSMFLVVAYVENASPNGR